jgi:hypothetical protein
VITDLTWSESVVLSNRADKRFILVEGETVADGRVVAGPVASCRAFDIVDVGLTSEFDGWDLFSGATLAAVCGTFADGFVSFPLLSDLA